MNSNQVWKAELYDNKLGYVSEFGKGVVELLNPVQGEKILDLGCGTGELAEQIVKAGAIVAGMDLSVEMIEAARKKYPHLRFLVGNAENFQMDEPFDAVFSNAALHWMKHPGQVVSCVWNALDREGRFVAEFGGQGNVDAVIQAITEVLDEEYGMNAAGLNPWYFPSIGEYSTLLERQGFRVAYAVHFDRPTRLEDGERGIYDWLEGFAGGFFAAFDEGKRRSAYAKIAAKAKPRLFRDGSWFIDYKRIRVMAVKSAEGVW